MNTFSKVLAFAILAAGAASLAPALPAWAQAARKPAVGTGIPLPTPVPACCTAAQRPVNTNKTWTVTPPSGPGQQAVAILSTPSWHAPFAGSQWIGPDANAGTNSEPAGDYVYSYHFCLCGPPKGVGLDFFPAALHLESYADNSFHAFLNNHPIGQDVLVNGFTTPTVIAGAQPYYFQSGDNEIKYVVNNISGPTGLDVSGWISGYFQPLGPDGRCPH